MVRTPTAKAQGCTTMEHSILAEENLFSTKRFNKTAAVAMAEWDSANSSADIKQATMRRQTSFGFKQIFRVEFAQRLRLFS